MPAFGIAKHLNVIEDIQPSFFPAAVDFSFDSLSFEQLKKTFCDSALSWQFPRRLMLGLSLWVRRKFCQS